jgi:prepilin-type N-terminal cleavage/methylation domain-containing protein
MVTKARLRSAFTLLELLVVVAIVAILAAILSPVFSQAKLAAKKTATISNLKQIALAGLMYSSDHDDVLPRTMDTSSGAPETVSWWAVSNYQRSLEPYMRNGLGGVGRDGRSNGKGSVWFDATDPDRDVPAVWGSFANNGFLTGMHRNSTTIEDPSGTVASGLRAGSWARVVGVAVPDPLPLHDPDDPFWSSEFFDMCFDPWTADRDNTASPYHYLRERAAPPCSLFPGEPLCEDWNSQLDGEWNENLHGLPREPRGTTRYGKVQVFSFADGHVKAVPFSKTYRSPGGDMWSVRKG